MGDLEKTTQSLKAALDNGFSVNTYVFYGGTNFAFEVLH